MGYAAVIRTLWVSIISARKHAAVAKRAPPADRPQVAANVSGSVVGVTHGADDAGSLARPGAAVNAGVADADSIDEAGAREAVSPVGVQAADESTHNATVEAATTRRSRSRVATGSPDRSS